jgi:hypothetical protein
LKQRHDQTKADMAGVQIHSFLGGEDQTAPTTDHRYECVSRKILAGTGQNIKWIESFTTRNSVFQSISCLLPFIQ